MRSRHLDFCHNRHKDEAIATEIQCITGAFAGSATVARTASDDTRIAGVFAEVVLPRRCLRIGTRFLIMPRITTGLSITVWPVTAQTVIVFPSEKGLRDRPLRS